MNLRVLLMSILFFLPNASLAAEDLTTHFTDQQLMDILKQDGYSAVSPFKEGVILVKINGRSLLLFNNEDGDLQAYYSLSGAKLDYRDMNTWNREHRLSRAYLDDEMDPVLEADLLANAGLSRRHVTEFFSVFRQSSDAFRKFVIAADHS